MSFIVRTVARTADGRDIVRPKSFDKAELSIGRSPSCDIHLPDLAVTLDHAVIRAAPGGYVEIAATAGLPFVVDGKSTEHARVSVSDGAIVRIGSRVPTSANAPGEFGYGVPPYVVFDPSKVCPGPGAGAAASSAANVRR